VTVRSTKITVETETLLIVRRARVDLAWCPDCRANVETFTLDAYSVAEPATAAQVREWLATGKLHSWKADDGLARICVRSLMCCLE
jgi:hypothetical protein